MRWSELKRSMKSAEGKPKGWEPRNPTLNARLAALDAVFDDVARRACSICHASLAQQDPYDLIELGNELVCVKCNQLPAVQKFRDLGTLRADVIARFQTLTDADRVQ